MCKKCGKPIDKKSSEIFRSSTCSFCGADLHSCVNCRFYSPGNHYDCRETVDELVTDKERANFCEYFSVAEITGSGSGNGADGGFSAQDKAAKARDAFNALFGD